MSKLKKTIVLLLVGCAWLVLTFAFAACGGTSAEYALNGVEDIEISATATTYDFLSGVTGTKNGENTDVSVDSSKVVFGTAGSYEVTYTCGDKTATATVRIYGTPVITGNTTIEVIWADMLDLSNTGLTAKDSFGTALTVTVEGTIARDNYGRIAYGDQEVSFVATDKVGNKASVDGIVKVIGQPSVEGKSTDLAAPEISLDLAGKNFSVLRLNGELVSSSNYTVNRGVLTLNEDYVATLSVGNNVFDIQFEDGYCDWTVTVTDEQAPTYTLPETVAAQIPANEVYGFPSISGESYQRIDVKYYIDDVEISDFDQTFTEEAVGEHKYGIKMFRNDSEIEGAGKEFAFSVLTQQAYYSRPIEGEEMASLFISAAPSSYKNTVTWDAEQKVFLFKDNTNAAATEDADDDNYRGFTFDKDYLYGIIKYSGATGFKLVMSNYEAEGQLFVSTSEDTAGTGWWAASGWASGGSPLEMEKELSWFCTDGEPDKTLWLLNTVGGFTLSFKLIYPVQTNVLVTYDVNGTDVTYQDIGIGGVGTSQTRDYVTEGYPEGGSGSALKVTDNSIYRGLTINLAESYAISDPTNVKVVMRVYIEGDAEQAFWFYNLGWALGGGDGQNAVKSGVANAWTDITFDVADFVIDGQFAGFKYCNFTGGASALYIDSISLISVTE